MTDAFTAGCRIISDPTNLESSVDALSLISSRWTLQILVALNGRQLRFTDLRRSLPGISANVLTNRLRELESNRLVARQLLPPPAAAYVYELDKAARRLDEVLEQLANWAADFSSNAQ